MKTLRETKIGETVKVVKLHGEEGRGGEDGPEEDGVAGGLRRAGIVRVVGTARLIRRRRGIRLNGDVAHVEEVRLTGGEAVVRREGVERAVIAEVDEQRIDRVIACLPQPDKDIVDDGAARVGDIERDEPHGDGKDLVRISLDFTYILQIHAGGFDKRPVSW